MQDHSGHPGTKSTVNIATAPWKATSQDLADTEPTHTNIELVGLLTISQNQTIFEISIRTTSIGNLDPVLRFPIFTARHDTLAIFTPIQTPCWAFSKYLCANSPVKKPSELVLCAVPQPHWYNAGSGECGLAGYEATATVLPCHQSWRDISFDNHSDNPQGA